MAEISIGDIVARLRLDASEFQRGMQQALQSVTQFQQQMQAQAGGSSQASRGLQQLTQDVGALSGGLRASTESVRTFGSAWRDVLAIAGGIGLATTVTQLVRSFATLAQSSVTLAARMQDLHRSFTAIEGSATAANRTIAFLFETANRLGVPVETLVDSFKRLEQAAKGSSLEGEGIRQAFVNITAGARTLGVSSENLRGAFVALEQAMGKGKFTAEEFRQQLAERLPGAANLIAQGLGLTTKTLSEMVDLGLIPVESAVIALGNTMGQLREKAQPGVDQLSETFARLKNETTAWMTALGQSIATTLQPFLQDLIKISETLRAIFRIREPGTQGAPGANQQSFLGRFFPGLLTPETLGMPPQHEGLPTEQPGARRPTSSTTGFASSVYDEIIRRAAEQAQIDAEVFSRQIREESRFNPRARSRAGALGLGQIMPETGREYGLTTSADFLDPEKNVTASAQIFRDYREQIRKRFGQLEDETRIVLAAYNAGIGRVIAAIEETQRIGEAVTYGQVLGRLPGRVPYETGPYVERIMGAYGRPGQASQATPFGTLPGGPAPVVAPTTAGQVAQQDPFAPMLKTATEVRERLQSIQERMTLLAQSGLNVGGILNDALNKQADEAVKKYTEMATTLASFPELLGKMTPAQREAVEMAGQQVLLIKQRLADEAQTEGNARRRIGELREIERLEERLNEEFERQQRQRIQEAARDLDIFGLMLSPEQEEELKQEARAQRQRIQEFARAGDLLGLELSPEQERQRRDQLKYFQDLENTLERMRVPAGDAGRFGALFGMPTQLDIQMQQGMTNRRGESIFTSEEDRRRATDLQNQIRQQERLIAGAQLFAEVGTAVGNAWTNALLGIANRTQTVAEAFRAMGQSIMQTLIQITSQEAFRAFVQLGVRLILGSLAGGATGGSTAFGGEAASGGFLAGATGGGGSPIGGSAGGMNIPAFQHGGVVHRPTFAMLGENPAMNPEYVVNRPQMESLLRAAPSAGGQAAGGSSVTVINVPDRSTAERTRMAQEAQGRTVILNTILSDMQRGEGSQINRMIRTVNR